jgi:hypothetical protein
MGYILWARPEVSSEWDRVFYSEGYVFFVDNSDMYIPINDDDWWKPLPPLPWEKEE